MSTALIPLDTLKSREFALSDYLATLTSPATIEHQQKLAAAYDVACRSLIGPNDVQKAGGKEFKKKSAWRKLARFFRITVSADLNSVRVETTPDGFTAFAVATAHAPWGQAWTDLGACGSDEERGGRTITVADACATAMTRASNRAVSNLVAMGEESAEEIDQKRPRQQSGGGRAKSDADKLMPFGRNKGVRLGDIDTADLESALAWCRDKGKNDIALAIGNVLNGREQHGEDFPLAGGADDDLPF
jgi:hypothetical protein